MAFDAFVQAVLNFPYADEPSLGDAEKARFGLYPETCRALFTAVERLTFLGAAELQLDGASISLLHHLRSSESPYLDLLALSQVDTIVGLVIMCQVQSILESGGRSKPKQHAVVRALLRDLLSVYGAERFPVWRAGVLVKLLEHAYYRHSDNDSSDGLESGDVEMFMQEIESLVSHLSFKSI